MKLLLTLGLLLLVVPGCQKSTPDTLVKIADDDNEMDAAIERARGEADLFVAELSKPTGEMYAVKVAIQDGEDTEHFWLNDLTYKNGEFHGTINNKPGVVKNVKLGQPWSVKKGEISDWMFLRDGKIHGNYTMRPLLKSMPPEEAAKYRAMLAYP